MLPYYDNPEYDYLYKISVIGSTDAGKTNLLKRFTRNEFTLETRKSNYYLEFDTKTLVIQDKIIKMQVWDAKRIDPQRLLEDQYNVRGTLGCFICYDIANRESFEDVKRSLNTVREHFRSDTVFMLIGNKSDLRHLRKVSPDEGKQFAEDNGLLFMETSALDNTNVELAFSTLAHSIYQPVHVKNKDDRLKDEIDRVISLRNEIINAPLNAYQSQGKKFCFFEKSDDRRKTLLNLQEMLRPILDKGQISGLTADEKLTIARHIFSAINETQASHCQGSLMGSLGITSSRLAVALQQSLDGFLAANGLTMDNIVDDDIVTENTHILM